MSSGELSRGALHAEEDRLFEEWQVGIDPPIVRDGALPGYTQSAIRTLFVLKEANNPDQTWKGDLRDAASWHDAPGFNRETWTTIARWTACLLDGRAEVGPLEPARWAELLEGVAVVNLKKVAGGSATPSGSIEVWLRVERNADLLKRQLALYRPHVTVCGGESVVPDALGTLLGWDDAGWTKHERGSEEDEIWERCCSVLGRVICFWHPAQRCRRRAVLAEMLAQIGAELRAADAGV